jgi:hypothetical protein
MVRVAQVIKSSAATFIKHERDSTIHFTAFGVRIHSSEGVKTQ